MAVIQIILWILTVYVGVGVFYNFFYAIACLLPRKGKIEVQSNPSRIAVFIPGYKEDSVIYHVAKKAAAHDYPENSFDVYVIADSFEETTLEKLRQLPVELREVSFEKSTKAKSLNQVMGRIEEEYDIAVILDADNEMDKGVLHKINSAYCSGFMAIQCHRTAKNANTHISRLDGLSEEINNSIYRKGHVRVGLSSALIGSGMAFDYKLFKNVMSEIDVISGFDKELEIKLLLEKVKVCYLEDADVYDEKVQSSETLKNQRSRWLASQVSFALKYYMLGWKKFFSEGNINLLDKTIQHTLLPRAFALVAMATLGSISFLFGETSLSLWIFRIFLLFTLAMFLAIPKRLYTLHTLNALLHLPFALSSMVASLFNMKKAKKTFINTPHHHFEEDEEEQGS